MGGLANTLAEILREMGQAYLNWKYNMNQDIDVVNLRAEEYCREKYDTFPLTLASATSLAPRAMRQVGAL